MQKKYRTELDDFREAFSDRKDKRIVLYGIGRYTATLVEGIKDFHFVGLMDKDPANVGRKLFSLPVVDKETAENIADIVVINTSETYWNVIYDRIKDMSIPVYYKNGKEAKERIDTGRENPYRDLSWGELKKKCREADVISFDFFDTLFVRCVINPRDVFLLIQHKIKTEYGIDIDCLSLRSETLTRAGADYTLDELYEIMAEISHLDTATCEKMKRMEIMLEEELIAPRESVVKLCREMTAQGKDVYIVSDMYMPKGFYTGVLDKAGIAISPENILISCERKKSKASGDIWEELRNIVGHLVTDASKNRIFYKFLHIGDDSKADVEIPRDHGIETYHTPSVLQLLRASSMRGLESRIVSEYASAVMGLVLQRMMNDPYAMGESGQIEVSSDDDMGYLVFGPLLVTFILWLVDEFKRSDRKKLVFMSRDGYFLKEDFDYACKLLKVSVETDYILASRQLAMMAAIEDDLDLKEYLSMPYSGTIKEMMEDRIGIVIDDELKQGWSQSEGIDEPDGVLEKYKDAIYDKVRKVRTDYKNYLKDKIDDSCCIVDLGYYGNNQRYLNKLMHTNMQGFYFNVNLSEGNKNTAKQTMIPCFQNEDDFTAGNSEVLKRMIFLESFLSAPHGMVKRVDKNGKAEYAVSGGNQKYFKDKQEINEGVKAFIKDYISCFGEYNLKPDTDFIDCFYGCCFDGSISYSDEVKRSFYNDNAMMNRIESQLFY